MGDIAFFLADQGPRYRRIDGNPARFDIGFVFTNDLVTDFFPGVFIKQQNCGAEYHFAGFRQLVDIDYLRIRELVFDFLDPAFNEALLLTGSVILGVFLEIAVSTGLMQVMRFWLAELGMPGHALLDIQDNIRMGCTILRYYYDMEGGNWNRALARYNGSLGSQKYPQLVFDRLQSRWYRQ